MIQTEIKVEQDWKCFQSYAAGNTIMNKRSTLKLSKAGADHEGIFVITEAYVTTSINNISWFGEVNILRWRGVTTAKTGS